MLNIPAMSFGGFRMSWVHETESWEMDTLNHILILTVAKIGHTDHQTWWRARVQLSKQIWYGFTICADNLIYGHVRLSLDWCGLLDSCFKGVWRNEMPENLENGNLKCRNGTRIGARKWNAPLSSQLSGIGSARPDIGIRTNVTSCSWFRYSSGATSLGLCQGMDWETGAPLLQNRNAEVKKNTGESVISPDSNPSLFSL